MRKTIAGHMLDIMDEKGVRAIRASDYDLMEVCVARATHTTLTNLDPKKRYRRIVTALEKSPLFVSSFARSSHENEGPLCRCFIPI